MALLPNINVGTSPNDGTGDSLRNAFTIVNENFQFIEAFFPNSSVSNLVANITSTGTSVFNIANVDVLNVNTISSFAPTNITTTNITVTDTGTFDTITANSITGSFTIGGNLDVNVTSTGNSSFNITSYSGNATFDTNVSIGSLLTVDTIDANTGTITDIVATNIVVGTGNIANVNSTNIQTANVSAGLIDTSDLEIYGNLSVGTALTDSTSTFQNAVYLDSRFYTNVVTVDTDVNLTISNTRAQTIIANLTTANLTVTLPNANAITTVGIWYTFICFDEGELDNRTLTVNVQPGAGNIFITANAENRFVNISAELGTNSINLRTNGSKWFRF